MTHRLPDLAHVSPAVNWHHRTRSYGSECRCASEAVLDASRAQRPRWGEAARLGTFLEPPDIRDRMISATISIGFEHVTVAFGQPGLR
jgi:hypothetical protein